MKGKQALFLSSGDPGGRDKLLIINDFSEVQFHTKARCNPLPGLQEKNDMIILSFYEDD